MYVIDLAPFHESTDPVLFDWPHLHALADAEAGAAHEAQSEPGAPGGANVTASTFLAAVAVRARDARLAAQGGSCQHAAVDRAAATPRVELRLVGEQNLTPTSQMYYGLPHDFREGEAKDLASLIATARTAAGEQSKAAADQGEDGPTGSESESQGGGD